MNSFRVMVADGLASECMSWCEENIGQKDLLWEAWRNTIYDLETQRLKWVVFFTFRNDAGAAAFKLRWS